jgi:hypothetical protein
MELNDPSKGFEGVNQKLPGKQARNKMAGILEKNMPMQEPPAMMFQGWKWKV